MFALKEIIKATDAKLIQKSSKRLLKGVSIDSRTIKRGEVFFAIKGDNFDGHDFIGAAVKKGAKAVVVSKEVKNINALINILKVEDTARALGGLAKYHRVKHNIPLIAITGSTGKTTTKDIVAEVLASQFKVLKNFGTYNNRIGVSNTVFKLNSKHKICVLELGTNHFGEISCLSQIARPQIGIITNIGESHLEFLKDLKGVLKEKTSIINNLLAPKVLLLNRDDPLLKGLRLSKEFKAFYFGIDEASDFMASDISLENNKVDFVFNKKYKFSLNTLGRFNVYSALVGIACGLIFGVSLGKIKKALGNVKFPNQRLNKIDCLKFSILDDTYNSNPLSLKHAIESLAEFQTKGRRILIMGDMLELGEHAVDLHKQIGSFIASKPIDMFVTLGRLSKATADVARIESNDNRRIFTFDSKAELINFLKSKIKTGDTLLIKGSRLFKMEDITSSLIKNAL